MRKSRSTEDAFNSIWNHLVAMIDSMDDDIFLSDLREDFDEETIQEAFARFHDALYAMRWQPRKPRRKQP